MKTAFVNVAEMMIVRVVDVETARLAVNIATLREATKHTNVWMRHLEARRKAMSELAELMGFDDVKEEIQNE